MKTVDFADLLNEMMFCFYIYIPYIKMIFLATILHKSGGYDE